MYSCSIPSRWKASMHAGNYPRLLEPSPMKAFLVLQFMFSTRRYSVITTIHTSFFLFHKRANAKPFAFVSPHSTNLTFRMSGTVNVPTTILPNFCVLSIRVNATGCLPVDKAAMLKLRMTLSSVNSTDFCLSPLVAEWRSSRERKLYFLITKFLIDRYDKCT